MDELFKDLKRCDYTWRRITKPGSVEVNGKDLSLLFEDSSTIVNGEVVQRSEERSHVIICGEDVPKLN